MMPSRKQIGRKYCKILANQFAHASVDVALSRWLLESKVTECVNDVQQVFAQLFADDYFRFCYFFT